MRKNKALLLGVVMLMTILLCGVVEAKTPSKSTLKKAYKSYFETLGIKSLSTSYSLVDLNGDKTKECIVSFWNGGARGTNMILGYKKKKVFQYLTYVGGISCYKKKKMICVDAPNGAATHVTYFYKIKGKKLILKDKYEVAFDYSTKWPWQLLYYHKNQKISKKTYDKKIAKLHKKYKEPKYISF